MDDDQRGEEVAAEALLDDRLKRIVDTLNEISDDHSNVVIVFAATKHPGHLATGLVGEPLVQLGLLGILENYVATPIAEMVAGSRAPRVIPAGTMPQRSKR